MSLKTSLTSAAVRFLSGKVELMAKDYIEDLAPASDEATRALRLTLAEKLSYLPNERAAANSGASINLGYLEALEALDALEHKDAVSNLFPVVLTRYVEQGYAEGNARPDMMLSNALFLLGREYLKYGSWEKASELFFYSAVSGTRKRTHARRVGLLSLLCAYNSQDEELIEAMDDLFSDIDDATVNRVQEILRLPNAKIPSAKDPAWSALIWRFGPLVGVLASEHLIRVLNKDGEHQAALLMSNIALNAIGDASSCDWLRALLHQQNALTYQLSGRNQEALGESLRARSLSQQLRYGECEHPLREQVWIRYFPCRETAIRCAADGEDAGLLASLLEQDRLQASLHAWLEQESMAEEDADPVAVPQSRGASNPSVPAVFFRAYEDVANSTRLIAPATSPFVEGVASTHQASFKTDHVEWWLGISRYGKCVYWSLLHHGKPFQSGSVNLLADYFLAGVLDDFEQDAESRMSKVNGLAGDGTSVISPFYHLAEWGTAEERTTSETLARLVPRPLQDALSRATLEKPIELVISAGMGFSNVPWPIIQLRDSRMKNYRLIERATIRHWASAYVESEKLSRRFIHDYSGLKALPLLVAVDDPRGDLTGKCQFIRSNSANYMNVTTGTAISNELSIKQHLVQILQKNCISHPPGVFFYRGHANSWDDPSSVVLELPEQPGMDGQDAVLPSGEFFGRYEDGSKWIPLPSRVVLSCCSSSSAALLGGEAVGLASACIVGGGASEVIATASDVYDSSFTSAFDDLLAEMMMDPVPHMEALRNLQVRMYDEWRLFSVRGGISVEDDIKFPHPLIWAMYQAI